MEGFHISRLQTSVGIFRLSGTINMQGKNIEISYETAELMGTDGWCALNIESMMARDILNRIDPDVVKHLSSNQQLA